MDMFADYIYMISGSDVWLTVELHEKSRCSFENARDILSLPSHVTDLLLVEDKTNFTRRERELTS